MENRSVDIIIPVYRPGAGFAELVQRLGRQRAAAGRLLIVNTEKALWDAALSSPLQSKELDNGTRVEVYHIAKEEFDHGGTRAWAAEKSDADILLFMTQDAMPQDDFLTERLLQAFAKSEKIGAVYARQLPAEDCRFLERYTRSFNYGEESFVKSKADLPKLGIKTYFCSNVCAAYRRDIYERLGGFERHTIFNEDMIFAAGLIQAGYKICYEAKAQVVHSHNYSGWQQLQRNFDLAVSQAEHPQIFEGVSSESEGVRLVKTTAVFLLKQKKAYLLPQLVWQSGCKYLGYRLGKKYRRLPAWAVRRLTMSPHAGFWKNKIF